MTELEIHSSRPGQIWQNNPVLVQLLGLSPVLALSSTLADGVGLGLATLLVCVLSCLTASALRHFMAERWRLLCFMLILASYTTAVDILAQLHFYSLYLRLGIYLPLISCNVAILVRMETVAIKSPCLTATLDALKTGMGFLIAIILFSATREFLLNASLFSDWQVLLPTTDANLADNAVSNSLDTRQFFPFAGTQAGALILLGMLVALFNFLSGSMRTAGTADRKDVVPAKRARVTGRLFRQGTKTATDKESS